MEDKEEKVNRKCRWFSFVSQNINNKIMLQPLGELWYPYMELILLILFWNTIIYDLLWFNGLLKGKTANFLTKQSDLSKKPTCWWVFWGFLKHFLKSFFGWILGGFFNANPDQVTPSHIHLFLTISYFLDHRTNLQEFPRIHFDLTMCDQDRKYWLVLSRQAASIETPIFQ